MTDYGTIKIPKDEYEQHNERRKANGQTWAEYIDGQAPERIGNLEPLGGEVPEFDASIDTDELAREVARQIDYAQLAGQVADEVEGRMR